jgi:hypothetical protein
MDSAANLCDQRFQEMVDEPGGQQLLSFFAVPDYDTAVIPIPKLKASTSQAVDSFDFSVSSNLCSGDSADETRATSSLPPNGAGAINESEVVLAVAGAAALSESGQIEEGSDSHGSAVEKKFGAVGGWTGLGNAGIRRQDHEMVFCLLQCDPSAFPLSTVLYLIHNIHNITHRGESGSNLYLKWEYRYIFIHSLGDPGCELHLK